MADRYWVGGAATDHWNENSGGNTNWGTSSGTQDNASIPSSGDDVIFDLLSGILAPTSEITANISINSLFVDSGVTETLTHDAGVTLTITTNCTFGTTGDGFLYTPVNPATSVILFTGTGTLAPADQTLGSVTVDSVGGTINFTALTIGALGTLTLVNGAATASSITISIGHFSSSNSNTRAVDFQSCTLILTGTGTVWNVATATNFVLNNNGDSNITIEVNDTSSTSKTFAGGGYAFYDEITFSGDNIIVSGSNTFVTFNVNNAGLTNGLKLTAGTTQTITSLFANNGGAGNLTKLLSTSSGSQATLSSNGTINVDYMSIKDSNAIGGATWNPGANSVNVSGNSGWLFPSTASNSGFFNFM